MKEFYNTAESAWTDTVGTSYSRFLDPFLDETGKMLSNWESANDNAQSLISHQIGYSSCSAQINALKMNK